MIAPDPEFAPGASSNRRGNSLALAASIALGVSGTSSMGLLPVLIGGFIDRSGFGLATSGALMSVQMLGMLVSNALLLAIMTKADTRLIALAAFALIIAGNVLAIETTGIIGQMSCRAVAGFGEGLTTLASALLVRYPRPERAFSLYTGITLSVSAANIEMAPYLLDHFGMGGLFGLMAVYPIIAFGIVPWLPLDDTTMRQSRISVPLRWSALLLTLIFFCGLIAVWAVIDRIGVHAGLTPSEISGAVGQAFLFCGIGGAASVPFISGRLGSVRAFVFAALGLVLASWALLESRGLASFALASAMFVFLWFVCFPTLMAIIARVDPSGRLAVGSFLAQTVGFVIGPALGSWMLSLMPLYALGAVASACLLFSLTLLPQAIGSARGKSMSISGYGQPHSPRR